MPLSHSLTTTMCIYVCVCVCICKQLPSNQSFDKQISSHQKGGGVSRWGEWVGKATAYKFDTCTLIGVHSTMHLVDPIKVHVSYTCLWIGWCNDSYIVCAQLYNYLLCNYMYLKLLVVLHGTWNNEVL